MSPSLARGVMRVHAWTGLVGGALLLLLSLTGVVLLFAPELDAALEPELLRVPPAPERASFDAMLGAVRRAAPDAEVWGFRLLPERADRAYTVNGRREGRYWFAHVDPYRGRVLGERDADASVVRVLLKLHYSLLAGSAGQAVVLGGGVLLLLSTFSGAWVYRKSLLRVFQLRVRTDRGPRAFSADAHRLVGVTSLLLNTVLAVTGVLILWPGVSAWALGGAEEEAPPARVAPWTGSVDMALARARDALPGLVVRGVVLPRHAGDPVDVYGHTQDAWLQGTTGCRVLLEPADLSVREVVDLRRASVRARLDAAVLPLHFGEWGGWGVRVLYAVLGLAPGALAVSGGVVALVRLKRPRGVRLHEPVRRC